jgi:UDP-N-acetylglucosamine 2-epimerase
MANHRLPPQANYEMMFGVSKTHLVYPPEFIPDLLPIALREEQIEAVMLQARKQRSWVLVFVIGTKPCFYKFYGAMKAAEAADLPHLVLDSGQHYDPLLTYGAQEFGYHAKTSINLQVRGDLAQKTGELFFKTAYLARYFKTRWPDVTVIPVVLGDTILTSIVPAAWLFTRNEKAIQSEAGLRSMAPDVLKKMAGGARVPLNDFIEAQFEGPWSRLTNEPFPEQYDTFTSAAGCQFHFAPVELNRQHLLEEGHDPAHIFVTGGVVVDALELKMSEKPKTSVFELHPRLKKGSWLRVDIHRRENLTPRRFKAIVGGVARLVREGVSVNFIEMNATKFALDQYGLRRDLLSLTRRKNFLFTPIWPEYAQVIEFYRSPHCLGALTDSGGLQEELNMLGQICLTCRFNTDRPETVREAHGNLLVPPISAEFVHTMVDHVLTTPGLQKRLRAAKPLYGKKVGARFIEEVVRLMRRGERPFSWSHERLGFWREQDSKKTLL